MKNGIKNNNQELEMTMQQRFNFDSNSVVEEDSTKYKKNKYLKTTKRIQEIKKLKDKYKKKYHVWFGISVIISVFLIISVCSYIFVKPKILTKTITQTVPIISENNLFLGDSITDFYDLKQFYSNSVYYVNSGINGNKTDDILNNMEERVYQYNPSRVFLLIGTNDIIIGRSEEKIVNNIKKIVSNIQKVRPFCKIYIESIYPINNTNNAKIDHDMVKTRSNSMIKNINKELKKYAEKEDIKYIDMYSILVDQDDNLRLEYTKEGLHISEQGYRVITKKIKEIISEEEKIDKEGSE